MKHLEAIIAFLNNTKEQVIDEILESNLTDIEKLRLLTENSLFKVTRYVKDPIPKEWTKECCDMERKEADKNNEEYSSDVTTTFFQEYVYNRDGIIMFIDIIDKILEYYDQDELVTVVRCAGKFRSTVKKPAKVLVDVMYKHCLKERIIGFTYD
jgi:hypothetical protein